MGQLNLEQRFLAQEHKVWLQLWNIFRQYFVAGKFIRNIVLGVHAGQVFQVDLQPFHRHKRNFVERPADHVLAP